MTEEEFKRRYIAQMLIYFSEYSAMDAKTMAEECYANCPQSDMVEPYASNPELAAEEDWQEFCRSGDDHDY